MILGKMISAYMQKYDVSCEEMAKQLNTSRTTLWRIVSGESMQLNTAIELISFMFKEERGLGFRLTKGFMAPAVSQPTTKIDSRVNYDADGCESDS